MRAKLKVTNVLQYEDEKGEVTAERLCFNAVGGDNVQRGYPSDGVDEDNTFARWTPNAELTMYIQNPNLFGKFAIDQKFYVDFTPAGDTA